MGSLLGAVLGSRAPGDFLLGLFAAFLLFAGILMVRSTSGERSGGRRRQTRGVIVVVVGFSFAVGVLSSLLGVGGGLLIFPFLVLYLRYQAQKAAGANAYIVTVSSLVGSLGHLSFGPVDYRLIGVTAIAAVIGSAIGSHVTVKASPRFVKVGFAFILWFFSVEIVLHLLKVI